MRQLCFAYGSKVEFLVPRSDRTYLGLKTSGEGLAYFTISDQTEMLKFHG